MTNQKKTLRHFQLQFLFNTQNEQFLIITLHCQQRERLDMQET